MDTTETRDYPIRVGDAQRTVYVTEATAEAIRGEANYQADAHLREATKLWDNCDVTDLEELQAIRLQLSVAQDCIETLVWLVPASDEEEDA